MWSSLKKCKGSLRTKAHVDDKMWLDTFWHSWQEYQNIAALVIREYNLVGVTWLEICSRYLSQYCVLHWRLSLQMATCYSINGNQWHWWSPRVYNDVLYLERKRELKFDITYPLWKFICIFNYWWQENVVIHLE